MVSLGTPFTANAKRVLLLGSGELGKEVVIELKRFGYVHDILSTVSYKGARTKIPSGGGDPCQWEVVASRLARPSLISTT